MSLPWKLSALALAAFRAAHGLELPAAYGPPADADPLTFGFYATHEIQQPTKLDIEGEFPVWLKGSLYRGAAGTWDVGNFTAEHWFDGFSRNHQFSIAEGSVMYNSRNGSDELAEFVRETGMYPSGSFGGDPCKIIFGAFETTYRDGDNPRGDLSSNDVCVAWAPNFPGLARNSTDGSNNAFDTLVTTTDANSLQQIDPVTLEPIELFTYQASDPLLFNSGRSAAHPSHGSDGSISNYILDVTASPPVYRVFTMTPPEGETKILANITDAPPAYIHSLFGTEKHLILVVWQADIVKEGYTIMSTLGPWDPERKTLFYVIDRESGLVSKYMSDDAFFAFHEINSFEDDSGDIYVDLARMNDTHFLEAAQVPNLRANLGAKSNGSSKNDLAGSFARYKLPFHGNDTRASNGSLITQRAELDFVLPYREANIELPRLNQEYSGKPYRYTYGIHVETPGYFADSLIKVDTETKQWKVWEPATKHLNSEPIFVAAPGAEREDDGVLLTVAMDAEARKSSLIVINATTMNEMGRARMPIVMGYGFHGAWGSGL